MGPVERDIERYLVKQCRQRGFLCLKFVSPARNGVPDRIVVTPAKTVFVELKRPGGSLRKIQRVMHAKLRRHGASVNVVDEHRKRRPAHCRAERRRPIGARTRWAGTRMRIAIAQKQEPEAER